MNNNSLEKCFNHVSNGWIIGCSILSCGLMSYAYLDGISKIPPIHMRRKYRLEHLEIENSINLSDKINNENRLISYYSRHN